jgi:hypothetical protein
MTSDELELTKEAVKESVKQAFAPVQDIVTRLLGPAATQVGLTLEDFFRVVRFKNAVRLLEDVKQFAATYDLTLNAVAPSLLFPILDAASLQDDGYLHQQWVALLANAAASPDSVHPSFIEVLRQLTPKDARLLNELYDSCAGRRDRKVQPWVGSVTWAEREGRKAAGENPEEQFQNLIRLGLIDTEYKLDDRKIKVKFPKHSGVLSTGGRGTKVDAKLDSGDYLTDFAIRFVKACRAPKTIDAVGGT